MSIVILHNMPKSERKKTTITTMNKQTNSTLNLKGSIISP